MRLHASDHRRASNGPSFTIRTTLKLRLLCSEPRLVVMERFHCTVKHDVCHQLKIMFTEHGNVDCPFFFPSCVSSHAPFAAIAWPAVNALKHNNVSCSASKPPASLQQASSKPSASLQQGSRWDFSEMTMYLTTVTSPSSFSLENFLSRLICIVVFVRETFACLVLDFRLLLVHLFSLMCISLLVYCPVNRPGTA